VSGAVMRVSLEGLVSNSAFFSCRGAVVQRHFQHYELHDDHEGGLHEERFVVVCAEPVEHPDAGELVSV
jgi:hypothetical protein